MNIFKKLLGTLVPNFKVGYLEIKCSGADVSFKTKAMDFIAVLRSTGFFLFFVVVAAVIFLVISPGRDALLLVVENTNANRPGSLISLLIGLFVWSIASEFGVRYSIYVTDNSGKSLSSGRAEWRRALQRIIAGFCLVLPSLLVMISLIIIQFTETSIGQNNMWFTLILIIFLVYWLLCILTKLYFRSYKQADAGKKGWFFSSERMSPDEQYWARKTYGIYNDYVFVLPKPENYQGEEKDRLEAFSRQFTEQPQTAAHNFPKDEQIVVKGVRVPDDFDFCRFETGGKDETASFRWVYSIPLSFYRCLHRQVKALFFGALVILILISLIPGDANIFEWMAAPGLLCGSFACWIGIYVGVLYIDYALLRKRIFSIRVVLLALFLCSSYFNNDHPVRYNDAPAKPRIAFEKHFEAWFAEYKKEMDQNSPYDKAKGKYPVVFICAEGGALRTGAYTAIFLDRLQDTLASHNINFKRAVYAMSGVSGGSLGLGYYNAANFLNKPTDFNKDFGEDKTAAQKFFIHDFLSPVIGKMFYGDLLNLFIPFHINRLDRAIGLEQSWEYAYKTLLKDGTQNTFAGNFLAQYDTSTKNRLPLLMINTTEVESGNQAWVTNVTPGNIIFAESRDLLGGKISKGLNYSTAINFSSRFPLFSPGGMLSGAKTVKTKSGKDTTFDWKLHYIDGGYYENTGAGSMFELLTQIKYCKSGRKIYPVVIYLRFSENPADKNTTINFGNELTEVVSGVYNTRSGRSTMAVQQLNQLSQRFFTRGFRGGTYIDEPLSENQRQVPMNWVLSRQSMSNIKRDVNAKLKDSSGRAALPIILNCQYDFPKINPALKSAPKIGG